MSRNLPLNEIIHRVKPIDADLLRHRPYLRPVYDDPSFIVRNVYRLYGGWYGGFVPELHPPPHADTGRDLVALAGGDLAVFVSRVQADVLRGAPPTQAELRRAIQLIEPVAVAIANSGQEPSQPERDLLQLRMRVILGLAAHEPSLIGRRIYTAAASPSSIVWSRL